MKLSNYLILVIICLFSFTRVHAQTKEDSVAIKKVCLDYVEGYFTKDVKRMENALHPELVKRTIKQDSDGESYLINLSKSFMKYATKYNQNENLNNPESELMVEVLIYDIFQNVASIKIINNQYSFIDYLHVGKFNGNWKIINVLWENYSIDKE